MSSKVKYWVFLFTVLASVDFFNFHDLFGGVIGKAFLYIGIIASTVIAVLYGVDLRRVRYPRVALAVMLTAIMGSTVMASVFHAQSLTTSFITTIPFFLSYLFFFLLLKLDIPSEKIIKTYIILFIASAFVYFCNLLTAPNMMFGAPLSSEDLSRGLLRIPVVFLEMIPLLVFYAINRLLVTKHKRWLWLIAGGVLMVILSVTRQVIALTIVLGLLFYFRNIAMKWKVLMVMCVSAFVYWVLPMIPVYHAMIELSEKQIEKNESKDDPRIAAWRFYTYENQTNDLSPIFGNGVPAKDKSRWANQFYSETDDNRCLAADVSWAGYFWYFGAIATISLLIIFIKALLKHKSKDQLYLNYWLVMVMIMSIMSGLILYHFQIISISVVLYLVFKKGGDEENERRTDSDCMPSYRNVPLFPQF